MRTATLRVRPLRYRSGRTHSTWTGVFVKTRPQGRRPRFRRTRYVKAGPHECVVHMAEAKKEAVVNSTAKNHTFSSIMVQLVNEKLAYLVPFLGVERGNALAVDPTDIYRCV